MGSPQPQGDAGRALALVPKMSGRRSQGFWWVPLQGSSFVRGVQGLSGSPGNGRVGRPESRMGSPAPSSLSPSNWSRLEVEGAAPVFGAAGRGAVGVDFEVAGRGPILAADFDGLSMLMTQSPIACGAFLKRLAWGVSAEAGAKVRGLDFGRVGFSGT